ncbi:MaoC/PaaZ C-terminal domain-containing protein [Amycolatopsis sp. PS_44_ISF1]|uniref:MaoC family dehydratase n=1 Tax=Amycolatopsis sp. PS_44_ISF1 TaxID=2974917 RepID=UPI0028DD70FF|nr:MaoC/PaaZ C-terminal domain-containing protein [Amycolatopsis sp. PS_44_ISF1]MDT8913896.1 MaoC/PaaZ C-terminal domain-containing protein [Amycolatopsis sp. PS_44_ISF1]
MIGTILTEAVPPITTADAGAYSTAIGEAPTAGAVSPFYAIALFGPLWQRVQREIGDQGIVHIDQRILVHRRLPAGRPLTAAVRITGVAGFGRHDAVLVHSTLSTVDGSPVASLRSTLAAPGDGHDRPPLRRPPDPARLGEAVRLERRFDDAAPARYAEASGDQNPVHLDEEAARAAGFPGRVVHGMCVLATGATAVAAELGGHREPGLGYLRARFARPVLPGDTVEYVAHRTGAFGTYRLGASVDGRAVFRSGLLRFRQCSRTGPE